MITLPQKLLQHIRDHEVFHAGDRVGVAVSGGADSVALLRLLIELRGELGIVLSVLHLNHNLRGGESDGDEELVAKLAKDFGLEFVTARRDVKPHAAEHKLSVETAAHEVRYAFFKECMVEKSLNKIATAHTLDDQAETVLMKLARGAGTKGLAGIYPTIKFSESRADAGRSGWIVRPLLGVRRFELEKYLNTIGQSWREDASNRDLRHTRNRVRHGILPRLERHVNPAARQALAEAAEIARAEEEYWAGELQKILAQVWTQAGNHGCLQCNGLGDFPLAVRRRLVRSVGESLGLTFEFRHVEEVLGLRKEGDKTSLSDGWIAERRKNELRFEKALQRHSNYEYALAVPGKLAVAEAGLIVETRIVNKDRDNSDDLLDLKFLECKLVVRNWRPGERFWPAHTQKPAKLKELLQDRHVTGAEKKLWPVIAHGEDVVWVRGLGVRRDLMARGDGGVLIRESSISANHECDE